VNLANLPQAPVVEVDQHPSRPLRLRALLQLGLAILGDRPKIGLGVEELPRQDRPLAAQRLGKLGARPRVHALLPRAKGTPAESGGSEEQAPRGLSPLPKQAAADSRRRERTA
jgi:hypothetical protein